MHVRDVSNYTMTSRWSRPAVAVFFFINGAALASWVPHIPAIKSRHMMSDGQLGLVLLSIAAGSVVALPVAGWLVGRLGSRVMTAAAGVALCLALPLPVASQSVALLSFSLALLGACNGLLDVSMNVQAAEVEQRVGRSRMFACPPSLRCLPRWSRSRGSHARGRRATTRAQPWHGRPVRS